ncbi:putative RNA-directed DNA polymerase [Tanacetum coccineum]
MKHDSLNDKSVSHKYESKLNLLNFFDNSDDPAPKVPNDDEREHSTSDGNVMASHDVNSSHPVDENATFATPLNENINSSEGQQSDPIPPRFNSESLSSTNFEDEPTYSNESCEPKSFKEAILDKNWIEAMNNKMEALFRNKTWVLVDLAPNRKTIGCKWLWKIKYKSTGEIKRYKARLAAKGFSQRDGIDYEENFSPVMKMVTVRCVISLSVHNNWPFFQLDVNNAFLYGDLHEDVYMDLPLGYYDPSETKVCKLVKSLYGLKQAPRQWNEKLTSVLNENGFVRSIKCIILCFVNSIATNGFVILVLLVYRGCQVAYEQNLSLSHEETDKDKRLINITAYQKLVCKLIYLSVTRPDISYDVHCLSQHMHAPLKSHFFAGLRVLRYLKQSPGLRVQVCHGNKLSLHAYSDADWAKCLLTRKSVSGFCVYFCGNQVSWKSKKQTTISRSSTEAEYICLASISC